MGLGYRSRHPAKAFGKFLHHGLNTVVSRDHVALGRDSLCPEMSAALCSRPSYDGLGESLLEALSSLARPTTHSDEEFLASLDARSSLPRHSSLAPLKG